MQENILENKFHFFASLAISSNFPAYKVFYWLLWWCT